MALIQPFFGEDPHQGKKHEALRFIRLSDWTSGKGMERNETWRFIGWEDAHSDYLVFHVVIRKGRADWD